MNVCLHTGYLKEAAVPYSNGAGEALLFLTLWVRDEEAGLDVGHKMRVERYDLIREYTPLLTPGRQMTVQSKSKLVPIMRHGVVKAEVMAFEVRRIEFHSRAKVSGSNHSPEGEAEPAPCSPQIDSAAAEAPLDRALRELNDNSPAVTVRESMY